MTAYFRDRVHRLDADRIDSGLRRSAEAYQHASNVLVAIDFWCGFLRIGNDSKQPQKKKQTRKNQSACVLFHFQNGLAGPDIRSERTRVKLRGSPSLFKLHFGAPKYTSDNKFH